MFSSTARSGPLQPCGVTSSPVLRGAWPGPQTLIHGAAVPPTDPSQCFHLEKQSRRQGIKCKQTRHLRLGAQSRRCGLTPGHMRGLQLAPLCHCGSVAQCSDECASLCVQPGCASRRQGWRTCAERPCRCLRPASLYQADTLVSYKVIFCACPSRWGSVLPITSSGTATSGRTGCREGKTGWRSVQTVLGRPLCHWHCPQPLLSLQTSASSLGLPCGLFRCCFIPCWFRQTCGKCPLMMSAGEPASQGVPHLLEGTVR